MSHSNSRPSSGPPATANDDAASESWDEALATDLAILGPVCRRLRLTLRLERAGLVSSGAIRRPVARRGAERVLGPELHRVRDYAMEPVQLAARRAFRLSPQ